ncbi:hypothetical protein NEOLEDRAFT_1127356 [Neolentinus lepideus HHB14362 ss-1]|uniref:Uncharacterized protein n=1 Tax=Neolentinus lepideus HHB14362 ss-1 TaxID=1314782 RepID=A0A165VGB0_9AGAM|nr:hypothetical protein NEOLEDRAFT_1127356 [Neolentinus lepideus HHB14362 ss-1]
MPWDWSSMSFGLLRVSRQLRRVGSMSNKLLVCQHSSFGSTAFRLQSRNGGVTAVHGCKELLIKSMCLYRGLCVSASILVLTYSAWYCVVSALRPMG